MTLNKYCQALAALRNKPAHELKEVGDQWRTPDLLFWGINALFGPLVLDLFADDDNAKCPVWYTAEITRWCRIGRNAGVNRRGRIR
ncbi:putative phage AdoMet-dependent methyltransferase [Escherichia coli]|nr:putative phage AdoMet-dependent methyltransferase [Escherichia coli]